MAKSNARTIYVPEDEWKRWGAEARRLAVVLGRTLSVSEIIRTSVAMYLEDPATAVRFVPPQETQTRSADQIIAAARQSHADAAAIFGPSATAEAKKVERTVTLAEVEASMQRVYARAAAPYPKERQTGKKKG